MTTIKPVAWLVGGELFYSAEAAYMFDGVEPLIKTSDLDKSALEVAIKKLVDEAEWIERTGLHFGQDGYDRLQAVTNTIAHLQALSALAGGKA